MSNSIIILGSSNSNGNTRKIINQYSKICPTKIIDLNKYQISYFDYEHKNKDDDFISLITDLLKYDEWIFATPVYWYSMSAVMKTFFDRLSDLLKIRKDLGRQLRGKSMRLIACSSNAEIYDWFDKPFNASAEYLDMKFNGMLWSWVVEGEISKSVLQSINEFAANSGSLINLVKPSSK